MYPMTPISIIKNTLFFLLIIIIGLYAGMHFFHEMCPVETQMDPVEYARYWKIVDGTFMHQRMGVMGPLMMVLFVVNIIANIKKWKTLQFFLLTVACAAFILDVALTVNQQLPINEFINALDVDKITNRELAQLKLFQTKAIRNFEIRFALGISSFIILCTIPFTKRTEFLA